MRSLQFSYVFVVLMGIALLSAFLLPKVHSDSLRATVETAFLTRPVHAVARGVAASFEGTPKADIEAPPGVTRTYRELAEENRALRVAVAHLAVQLGELKEMNAERAALGSLKQYCRPMRVTGSDSTLRRSLILQGDMRGLRAGMPVIHASGLIGKLDRVGWSGVAQVQLVSDRGFRATARFVRIVNGRPIILGNLAGVVEGDGREGMLIRNLPLRDVSEGKLAAGDFAVLGDTEYPQPLQGYRIGEIVSLLPSRNYPLFAEITIRPMTAFQKLQEVMVFSR